MYPFVAYRFDKAQKFKIVQPGSQSTIFSGMFAIRAEREFVIDEDFMKAVRKVGDAKRLETKLDYKPV